MALSAGTKLGPYEIVSPIGAGGMGEVYKARDTRLDRTVAIKILPEHLAQSPERRARFEREGKAISRLNHPHICTLYDVGEQDGIGFLVMEYIEGETLADRLRTGALPLDEAFDYGIQIAGALDKAHRAGIVHRDLKPANVMLTDSGVKLLDFGLARLVDSEPISESSDAPTRQQNLTKEEAIIGTLQYMAPEQLESRASDARTDLFAFGAVLYEMVTGRRAFEGKSQASLVTAIMSAEPLPISNVETVSPLLLDHLVRRCLAKDPDARWQVASDVEQELRWIRGVRDEAMKPVAREGVTSPFLYVLGGGVVVGLLVWGLMPKEVSGPVPVRRAVIPLSEGSSFAVGYAPNLALSPDGTRVVFAAQGAAGRSMLYVRLMNEVSATPLSGTERGSTPFFSPDGKWVGFQGPEGLQKVALSGGAPVALNATGSRGASWAPDGTIIIAPGNQTGLQRIPADGGEPEELTRPNREVGEKSHRLPEVLPGGEAVVFTIGTSDITSFDDGQIAVLDFATGDYRVLIEGGQQARYVPTGHLVYARAGSLLAVPFDLGRLEVTGPPVSVAEGVLMSPIFGSAEFAVAADGTLAYVLGTLWAVDRRVVWVDREGNAESLAVVERAGHLRLSPAGDQLVINTRGANDDLWIYDLTRGTQRRLTAGWDNYRPIWSPDGTAVTFISNRDGPANIYSLAADGSGQLERLTSNGGPVAQSPTSWSPDGRSLVYTDWDPESGSDIWVFSMDTRESRPLVQSPFNEGMGEISPDGRLLAYVSDESGHGEVYVQSFPELGRKWPISTEGGTHPVWTRHGQELVFLSGEWIMAVAVAAPGDFKGGAAPRSLFRGRVQQGSMGRVFDVTADGQRFALIEPGPKELLPTEIHVVFNWFEELKRLVPTDD